MRAPEWATPTNKLYRAAIEMAAFADDIGVDQVLAKVPAMPDRSTFTFQPLLGGLSPDEGWKSLELLKQTMPKLKAAMSALD